MAEGQARSLGYDAAHQYYKQALELDPRSVYVLVSYALFKLELNNFGEAEELMKRAADRCTKKTGYYVYYNMGRVYDSIRDRHGKIRALRKALEYDPNRTVAQHMLGVAQSQNANYDEALSIFDSIIDAELARPIGPRDSLVYALKTKVITLRHAKRDTEAQRVLEQGLRIVRAHKEISHLAPQLEELVDQ
jgi:tetratricopeptide (TPR) repeat protein